MITLLRPILLLITINLFFVTNISAQQKEEESPPADFLDFQLEVEDAAGDGFNAWLEATSDDVNEKN